MELKKRTEQMFNELQLKKTTFCSKAGISVSTYYAWTKGRLNLSDRRMQDIDRCLKKLGY